MQKVNTIDRTRVFNLLKFVGAVLIFYFGLKLLIPNTVNESLIQENLYEGVEYSDVEGMDEELKNELGNHDAAHNITSTEQIEVVDHTNVSDGAKNEYKLKFQDMCLVNSAFCMKIKFNGEYDYKDQYMYLASAIYVLNFIDKHISLNKFLKNQLKTITINPSYNSRRGYANWSNITINLGTVSSYVEFMELISHELGHIVDLGVIKGSSSRMDNTYTEFGKSVFATDDPSLAYYKISWDSETIRKASASTVDFCSSYGMSDPFEDFAECHNLYLNHNALFKYWAQSNENLKKKYNFFANLYGGAYMFASSSDLQKYSETSRPWDTTKM